MFLAVAPLYVISAATLANYLASKRSDLEDGPINFTLTVVGLAISVTGFAIWIAAMRGCLWLPYAKRLKVHPDVGLLSLVALLFFPLPIATSFAIWGSAFSADLWGAVGQESFSFYASFVNILISFSFTCVVITMHVIARVEPLSTIVKAILALFVYAFIGIIFSVTFVRQTSEGWQVFYVFVGLILSAPFTNLLLVSRRLRYFLFYPAFVAVPLLNILFANSFESSRGDPVPLLLIIVVDALLLSFFSWSLRKQLAVPGR